MKHAMEGLTVHLHQYEFTTDNKVIQIVDYRDEAGIDLAEALPPFSGNPNLDFWAQIITIESELLTRNGQQDVAAIKRKLVAAIEMAILEEREHDHLAFAELGVPTFVELVLANPEEFQPEVVRKAASLAPTGSA